VFVTASTVHCYATEPAVRSLDVTVLTVTLCDVTELDVTSRYVTELDVT